MTQIIHAIYEGGVFRPLDLVQLAEKERVVLTISEADAAHIANAFPEPSQINADVLKRQREALTKLRADMDALPLQSPDDGLGGADHDVILYDWRK